MAHQELDLHYFRRRLEELRASTQEEVARRNEDSRNVNQTEGYGVKNHPAEDATEVYDRERNLAVENEMQRELERIEHALARMDAGQYGICEVCGAEIPVERLEARPAATLCIVHQRENDQQAAPVPGQQV